MQSQPKITKRQALLAILGATPVLAYGRQLTPGMATSGAVSTPTPTGFSLGVDVSKSDSSFALLELNIKTGQLGKPEFLFLKVNVDGKEEVRVSIAEAIQILKGAA